MSGTIGYTSTQKSDLEYALDNLCDAIGAVDLADKVKSNAGFTVASLICDAGGNTLFSYDTVIKYYIDADGTEYITAEVLGKIIETAVFDISMKQTIKTTLAAATEPNPLFSWYMREVA